MGILSNIDKLQIINEFETTENFLETESLETDDQLHGSNFPPIHFGHFNYSKSDGDINITSLPFIQVDNVGKFRTSVISSVDDTTITTEGYSGNLETDFFGLKSSTNSSLTDSREAVYISKYTLATSGTIQKITFTEVSTIGAADGDAKGVIYEDDDGSPGDLFAVGDEVTVSGDGPTRYTSNFSGSYADKSISAGNYWLGFHQDPPSSPDLRGPAYVSQTNTFLQSLDTYSNGPVDPFGAIENTFTGSLAVYVTYDPDFVVGQAINYIMNRRVDT